MYDWIRVLIFIIPVFPGIGQDQSFGQIHLIGRSCRDSICLRWAPSDFEGWNHGNSSGYSIFRTTILSNSEILISAPIKLNLLPFKPLPLENWESITEHDEYAAIAAQAIYGKEFIVTAGTENASASIINKMNDQEARFSFGLFASDQSPLVARAAGLWFTDTQIVSGEKYLYRVFFNSPLHGDQTDTALFYTGPDEFIPLPKPMAFEGESSDKAVLLHWNQKYLESLYTSYVLERSADSGRHYTSVNDHPLIKTTSENFPSEADMVFIDSIPENNHQYIYRLRGKTSFGELGPWSDSLVFSGIPGLKSFPVITETAIDSDGNVSLHWTVENNSDNEINSFYVLQSETDYGPADTLNKIYINEPACYVDTRPRETNYYRIVACPQIGNCRSSFSKLVQLPDTIPPKPPEIMHGQVDTSGIVFLHWKPSPDKDIYGYRIYRSTKLFEEASLITSLPVMDTVFTDTIYLDNLSEQVCYSIMALDKRQNRSILAGPFRIEKPDLIPPAFPQILSAFPTEAGISLSWIPSASSDIDHYTIIRTEKDKPEKCIAIIPPLTDNNAGYTDTSALPGIYYTYYIQAYDHSGLFTNSPSKISSVYQPAENSLTSGIWKIKTDRNAFLVHLQLKETFNSRVLVYKGVYEDQMRIAGCIKAGELQWADSNLLPGTKYFYYLVKLEDTGARQILGPVKSIEF
jgi:uncharacterized protein